MADEKSSDAPESNVDESNVDESKAPGAEAPKSDAAPEGDRPPGPELPPYATIRPEADKDKGAEASATPPPPDYGDAPGKDDEEVRGDYKSRSETFRARTEEATAKMRGATEEATAKVRGAAASAQETTREHMNTARSVIGESEAKTLAIAAYLLNLTVVVTGLGPIAAAILAYVKRDDADAVIASHLEFQIRTFWIGLAALIVGLALLWIVIGALVLFALGVWWLLRNVVGLIRLLEGKPIPDPKAWLF